MSALPIPNPGAFRAALLNGSALLAAIYLLDGLAAVPQNVIFARSLEIGEFGTLAALLSAGMFAFVLSDFGTSLSVCRLMAAADEADWVRPFRTLWTARLCLSFVSTALFLGVAIPLFPGVAPSAAMLLSSELFRSAAHFLGSAARGAGKVWPVVAVTACDRVGTLVGSVVAILFQGGLRGVAAAFLLARIASFILAMGWALHEGLPLRPTRLARGAAASLAPMATQLLSDRVVFYSMPLLISILGSTVAAGMFQASLKIALVPISLCSALAAAYFPAFVREAGAGASPLRAVAVHSLVSAVAAPLVALSLVSPSSLLVTLFGPAFAPASASLRLLGVFIVLNVAHQLIVHLLPVYRREGVLLRTSSVAALACVLLAGLAIPIWGAMGAAAAMTLYAVVALVPNGIALRASFRLSSEHRRMLADGCWTQAGCFFATLLLPMFFHEPGSLLVGWTLASAPIVGIFLSRNGTILGELVRSRDPIPLSLRNQKIAT